jgi:hypothetical protein
MAPEKVSEGLGSSPMGAREETFKGLPGSSGKSPKGGSRGPGKGSLREPTEAQEWEKRNGRNPQGAPKGAEVGPGKAPKGTRCPGKGPKKSLGGLKGALEVASKWSPRGARNKLGAGSGQVQG